MARLHDLITFGRNSASGIPGPLDVSQNRLARDIDVPVSRIAGIVKGYRAISADTALRFAQYFGTSAEMWLALQSQYDLRLAQRTTWPKVKLRIKTRKAA